MKTRAIHVGSLQIGGGAPIVVQSMTNTKTHDVEATVKQILELEEAGCELVRVAVPDMEAAKAISKIKSQIHIPLVADIHFDYRLALEAIEQGIDKIRINPGNIGDEERVEKVVQMAKTKKIPIRIGVNSGSLERDIYVKHGGVTADALCESAMRHVKILEKYDFYDTVISIKSTHVKLMVDAYEKLSQLVDYPLHLGVTEAGTQFSGTVKSSIGIGALLLRGIGDTIRVSLTDEPVEEIKVAKKILEALELRDYGVKFISCPTCGRTNVDLVAVTNLLEGKVSHIKNPITVAVMGCAVNGPGEARDADIGIAGGNGEFLLFKKGIVVKKFKEDEIVEALLEELEQLDKDYKKEW